MPCRAKLRFDDDIRQDGIVRSQIGYGDTGWQKRLAEFQTTGQGDEAGRCVKLKTQVSFLGINLKACRNITRVVLFMNLAKDRAGSIKFAGFHTRAKGERFALAWLSSRSDANQHPQEGA